MIKQLLFMILFCFTMQASADTATASNVIPVLNPIANAGTKLTKPEKPVDFVRRFYVALDIAESVTSIGRNEKLKDFFDPKLYQLLLKDDEVRDNNQEPYVCGFLRFDAYVNDRKNRGIKNRYILVPNSSPPLVGVAFLDNEGPAVYVQLEKFKNSWKIANFEYPNAESKQNKSLIDLLETAQKAVCQKSTSEEAE